jgi:hypothetical protein
MHSWHIDGPQRLTIDESVARLEIWFARGKVRVVGTEGPARVEIVGVGRKGLTASVADGVLSLRHVMNPGWLQWAGPVWWFAAGRHNHFADVIVAVPPSASAGITVVDGSVVTAGLRGGSTVDVTSGRIVLTGLDGRVRAKTVSGSIEALRIGGDLGLHTVSGDISLAESPAERVTARTISGSVTCDLDNPLARDVRLDTTSGSITVRVPADADLHVHLSATSGSVRSAFDEVRPTRHPGPRAASGRLGSGKGNLCAYAVSGSVALLARPDELS